MKPSSHRIGQHFRSMKKAKKHPEGMHVINLPPEAAEIYRQICRPRHGGAKIALRCPFCRGLNIEGEKLCCDQFRAAIVTIMETAAVPVMVN